MLSAFLLAEEDFVVLEADEEVGAMEELLVLAAIDVLLWVVVRVLEALLLILQKRNNAGMMNTKARWMLLISVVSDIV
jgi:hypothetical protein